MSFWLEESTLERILRILLLRSIRQLPLRRVRGSVIFCVHRTFSALSRREFKVIGSDWHFWLVKALTANQAKLFGLNRILIRQSILPKSFALLPTTKTWKATSRVICDIIRNNRLVIDLRKPWWLLRMLLQIFVSLSILCLVRMWKSFQGMRFNIWAITHRSYGRIVSRRSYLESQLRTCVAHFDAVSSRVSWYVFIAPKLHISL